jgi:hypothetical protein
LTRYKQMPAPSMCMVCGKIFDSLNALKQHATAERHMQGCLCE